MGIHSITAYNIKKFKLMIHPLLRGEKIDFYLQLNPETDVLIFFNFIISLRIKHSLTFPKDIFMVMNHVYAFEYVLYGILLNSNGLIYIINNNLPNSFAKKKKFFL